MTDEESPTAGVDGRRIDRVRRHETSYSDLVTVRGPGRWLFVSGQLAFDEERRVIEGDVTAQTRRCLEIIEQLLAEQGSGLQDVVRITTYLTNLADYPEFDRVRAERFGEHRPASAAFAVAGLLMGARIEIEALAFAAEDAG